MEGARVNLPVRRLADLSSAERERLLARATAQIFDAELVEGVREILLDVRDHGDEALVRALARYDGVECPPERIRITLDEIEAARASVGDQVTDAIRTAIANVRAFNERVLEGATWLDEIGPGITAGEQSRPVDSAGLFVPCGKGSFPSVLVQIGTPAVVAGVPEIAVVVPPVAGRSLEVDPAVLVVASELGLRDVFRVNGPAGIAALAFGTETIPRVGRVVGPGSPAVTAAQVQVQAFGCATVMLFGPSESLVIADDSANPTLVAADVLNEAEHGADSAALLVTASTRLVDAVQKELARQLADLPEPRRSYAAAAVSDLGGVILVNGLDEACAFANDYAPEHLQLATSDPESLLPNLDHAGEILLGQTPFAAANYVLGAPATLPTGRFARQSSGVTARTFVKTSSIAGASAGALHRLGPAIVALADHEGFPAHAAAIHLRERA
jgi:histidinol dehydrogenase